MIKTEHRRGLPSATPQVVLSRWPVSLGTVSPYLRELLEAAEIILLGAPLMGVDRALVWRAGRENR